MLYQRKDRSDEPAFRIRLKGGTNVPKSPSSEYMQQVFFPSCERIGLPKVDVNVIGRGWTTGAPEIGEVEICVSHPKPIRTETTASRRATSNDGTERAERLPSSFQLQPFTFTRPARFTIKSISMTTLTGSSQMQSLLQTRLRELLRSVPAFSSQGLPILVNPSSTSASGDERRLYVLLTATTSEGFILGRDYLSPGRKISDEADRRRTVDEAVNHVVRDLRKEVERGGCVDEFAEDQLVIFQALAEGASRLDNGSSSGLGGQEGKAGEVETGSLHTRTVRWVCSEMLGTVFDGVGGCEGRALREREEEDVEGIRRGLANLDVDEEETTQKK